MMRFALRSACVPESVSARSSTSLFHQPISSGCELLTLIDCAHNRPNKATGRTAKQTNKQARGFNGERQNEPAPLTNKQTTDRANKQTTDRANKPAPASAAPSPRRPSARCGTCGRAQSPTGDAPSGGLPRTGLHAPSATSSCAACAARSRAARRARSATNSLRSIEL